MPHLLLDYLRLAELTSMPAVRGCNSVALRCRVLVLILPRLGLLLPRPRKNNRIILACGDTVPSIFHDRSCEAHVSTMCNASLIAKELICSSSTVLM